MTPAALTKLAFVLADDEARCHFHSNAYPVGVGTGWHHIPDALDRDGAFNRALRYLRARDMLVQNPKDKTQCRTRPAPKPDRRATR